MNSRRFAMDGEVRIVKRDGSVEAFSFPKLLNCIQNGFHSSGETIDRHQSTSRGLAEAVQTYLHNVDQREHEGPIASHDVARLVELVLTQTGYVAASMAIKRHADLRKRQRNWVKVAHKRPSDGLIVQKRWNKTRIVAHLLDDHHLEPTTARIVSGRVEQIVFNCGLKVVTENFVKETVNSELLAWGLLPGALAVKQKKKSRGGLKAPHVEDAPDTA
ncbi:MAG TPA: ATP cone domain-containing protein [Phycisphaerae bacterium]|nr:ATP cone domain-containing protein [Phycisphaerae bacterium]